MLQLEYHHNAVLVFDVDAWISLRKKHKIVGELAGNTNFVPTLPAKLLPEEALYLQEEQIATIVISTYEIAEDTKSIYDNFEDDVFKEEQIVYKSVRKRQLESMIDNIIQGKKIRGDTRSRDEIFNEELEKSSKITKENMIWPTLLNPKHKPETTTAVSSDAILKHTTKLKYLVFKDLHDKGYYVTSAHKFGGDFLVYLGDPIVFHAIFIVRCVENLDERISPSDIVGFGRLGTSVRKRAVLASLDENGKVLYVTINWIDA